MTVLVLNEETAKTSLGDLLRSSRRGEIAIQDESGRLLALLVVASSQGEGTDQNVIVLGSVDELNDRRPNSSDDVTTADFLARLMACH